MQSLEARKADRKKREAENREEAKERGIVPQRSASSFDVDEFLGGDVQTITGGLADLTDEQFAAVVEKGDKRAGVKSAIESDAKRREKRGNTNWSPNS